MTIDKFISRHAAEWEILKPDLVALIDHQSPAHQADKLDLKNLTEFNQTFAATIAGFAHCRNFLEKLDGSTVIEDEPPSTFITPPETEILSELTKGDPPSMPKPRTRKKQ